MKNVYERIGFYMVRFAEAANWKECANTMIEWYRERLADNKSSNDELEIECYMFLDKEEILFEGMVYDYTEEDYEWYEASCIAISDAHLASI
jgi:hypothetical protein